MYRTRFAIGLKQFIEPDVPGRSWYGEPDAVANAIGFAKFYSCSHDAAIRVYDDAGNVTHQQAGDFKEW